MPVFADPFPAIVFNARIGIFLSVNKKLLAALLILKPDLVESAAAQGTVRLDAAARLVGGQFVGWHGVGVVHAADDDRPVRVPFEKGHDHFMTDPRNKYRAPLLARP